MRIPLPTKSQVQLALAAILALAMSDWGPWILDRALDHGSADRDGQVEVMDAPQGGCEDRDS